MRKNELKRRCKMLENRAVYLEGLLSDYRNELCTQCEINYKLRLEKIQTDKDLKSLQKEFDELGTLATELILDTMYLKKEIRKKDKKIETLEARLKASKPSDCFDF